MSGWKEIADFVLQHDYCCGCGVCAGICPQDALQVRFNENGQYRPYLVGKCTGCGLCSTVCPFADGNPNEDDIARAQVAQVSGIEHTSETGYYLDSFVGHVTDPTARWKSASGGIATWLLQKLLATGEVDHVLCVLPHDDPNRLFRYHVCETSQDVQSCSRSCYYPVAMDEMVPFVMQNDGRYAVTALPCVCKAIRLAQHRSRILSDRIKYVIGLVCGQMKSTHFAEYVCALGGGDPRQLMRVEFRVKDMTRPASDFGLRFYCEGADQQNRTGIVHWTQGMGQAWSDRYFTPNACNLCDDVFAECADGVLMDAWLPRFSNDPKGHTIVLTRNRRINDLFVRESQCSAGASLQKISIDLVIRSQLDVLCSKRGSLRDRIFLLREQSLFVPTKRWNSLSLFRPWGLSQLNAAQLQICRRSSAAWTESGRDLRAFLSKMQDLRDDVEIARRRYRSYHIPNRLLRKVGLYRQWATTRFYS